MTSKKKILIIEDSEDILRVTTHILSSRGYEPIALNSGRDALENVKKHQPQLIILDMFLDEHYGLDICHAIKSDPALTAIPIIMTTGHRDDTGDPASVKPDAYLLKPFELDDLLQKISELLTA